MTKERNLLRTFPRNHVLNTATQFLTDLTRSLVSVPAKRIRSTTARIISRPRHRLDTSPQHVREESLQLLLRAQEFAKLNAYPDTARADITLAVWNICVPLERYYGCNSRSQEYDLLCHLRAVASQLDHILFAELDEDAPSTTDLMKSLEVLQDRFCDLIHDC